MGEARPCVLTVEGSARVVAVPGAHLVRVSSTAGVFLVDPGALDISLKYLDEAREWRDGDVVTGTGSTVLTREGGQFHQVTQHGVSVVSDAAVSQLVDAGDLSVLRYQGKREA